MTDGIYARLTSDQSPTSLYTAVGGRIFSIQGDKDVSLPYLVFRVTEDDPIRYFSVYDLAARVDIDLWGDYSTGYDSVSDIDDKLFALLDKQAMTITGFSAAQSLNIGRGVPSVEEDAVRITSTWRIFASG